MNQYDKAIAAATEYAEGLKLREQKKQFSAQALGKKFDCGKDMILAIAKGATPPSMPKEDIKLIRACQEEAKAMNALFRKKTMQAVCCRYRVTGKTVREYLEIIRDEGVG